VAFEAAVREIEALAVDGIAAGASSARDATMLPAAVKALAIAAIAATRLRD